MRLHLMSKMRVVSKFAGLWRLIPWHTIESYIKRRNNRQQVFCQSSMISAVFAREHSCYISFANLEKHINVISLTPLP
jgi:hypothetical protein